MLEIPAAIGGSNRGVCLLHPCLALTRRRDAGAYGARQMRFAINRFYSPPLPAAALALQAGKQQRFARVVAKLLVAKLRYIQSALAIAHSTELGVPARLRCSRYVLEKPPLSRPAIAGAPWRVQGSSLSQARSLAASAAEMRKRPNAAAVDVPILDGLVRPESRGSVTLHNSIWISKTTR